MVLIDTAVDPLKSNPYTKANLAALSDADYRVDSIGTRSFSDIDVVPPPETIEPTVHKLPVVKLTDFRVYSKEELEKMDIQQLLMTLLQSCYLVQHKTKHLDSELIATLQMTLDVVVKRLSEQQASKLWSIPKFIGIGIGAAAGFFADYKDIAGAVGKASETVSDIMQQHNHSQKVPTESEQSQIHSQLQTLRERKTTANNEEEKTLSSLERALNAVYELCMRMF